MNFIDLAARRVNVEISPDRSLYKDTVALRFRSGNDCWKRIIPREELLYSRRESSELENLICAEAIGQLFPNDDEMRKIALDISNVDAFCQQFPMTISDNIKDILSKGEQIYITFPKGHGRSECAYLIDQFLRNGDRPWRPM